MSNSQPATSPQLSAGLVPISFSQIKGWGNEDHLASFNCFKLSVARMSKKPYKTKALGVSGADLADIAKASVSQSVETGDDARKFFEINFIPHKFDKQNFGGMLTGYFEPELAASLTPNERFRFPLYRRPEDLIDLDVQNRPEQMDNSFAFGRQTSNGIEEYFDRGQIQDGALEGRGLELVWLDNPVDVFFTHIQGSAHLMLTDGSQMRVSYAAKTGHPYTAIGKILVDRGEMKLEDVTMQSIRQWIGANTSGHEKLLAENRSYIFFQETHQPHPQLGPVAAAGVPLTAGRSLAVDHKLHTFGIPIWVETKENFVASSRPFARLMIAQDTGSAIIGGQRGDLFVGSGKEAGTYAGQIKHTASMIVLVPNPVSSK